MKKLIFAVILGLTAGIASASTPSIYATPENFIPAWSTKGLFNPAKFDMSHQMSFSYASTMGGVSQSTGLYLNTLSYNTDSPLKLKLHMGYKYQPNQANSFGTDQGVIPGVSLTYQISPNHTIGASYGINEQNSQLYNSLDHSQKPYNIWYNGSFLNNKLQLNVNVTNAYYYPRYSFFDRGIRSTSLFENGF